MRPPRFSNHTTARSPRALPTMDGRAICRRVAIVCDPTRSREVCVADDTSLSVRTAKEWRPYTALPMVVAGRPRWWANVVAVGARRACDAPTMGNETPPSCQLQRAIAVPSLPKPTDGDETNACDVEIVCGAVQPAAAAGPAPRASAKRA